MFIAASRAGAYASSWRWGAMRTREGFKSPVQMTKSAGIQSPGATLSKLQDEELMEVLVAGDKAAFDILVQRHKVRLYSYLLRLVRDPSAAEDLTQEALVRAYVHADKYRNIAKFSTWLYTIATN